MRSARRLALLPLRERRALDGFAVGYFEDAEDAGKLKNNLTLHGNRGASAGGGWSTAADLHRFFLAMRDNRIVKAATREVLWSPKPLTPTYGYGFQIGSGFAGPGWVGHDGGFPGVEAFASYNPCTGHTLVVLSNYYDAALPLMEAFPKEFHKQYEKIRSTVVADARTGSPEGPGQGMGALA